MQSELFHLVTPSKTLSLARNFTHGWEPEHVLTVKDGTKTKKEIFAAMSETEVNLLKIATYDMLLKETKKMVMCSEEFGDVYRLIQDAVDDDEPFYWPGVIAEEEEKESQKRQKKCMEE